VETLRAIQKLLESCIGGYGETIRREEVEGDNILVEIYSSVVFVIKPLITC